MLQKLSPQQIQLMKLLQIPTATLEQRIKEELESNPALEEGDGSEEVFELGGSEDDYPPKDDGEKDDDIQQDYELDDYLSDYIEDDPSSYKLGGQSNQTEEEDRQAPIAVESSFHDYLDMQLGLLNLQDERTIQVAQQIIGSIDDDGYLRREPLAILDDLLFAQNIESSEEEINSLLKLIQRFDPPGVGARNLQESLVLQMKAKIDPADDQEGRPAAKKLALQLLIDYFDEFSKKHYQKLQKYLEITEDQLKEAIEEILKLNPKPASGYSGGNNNNSNQYIVPDFIIMNRDGELELSLNSRNAPDLRINDHYLEMLKGYKDNQRTKSNSKKQKEAIIFIKQKIDSAKWFIDAIRQRQETLFKTMYAILQFQYEFFLTGDQRQLRPMILKDIAELTGLDISTVSRVANSKFVQTEFGTKRLKDFFSESLQNQDGEEVSTLEVKKILSDIVGNESKRKPLSDEKLKSMLLEKGYNIARRTVAKYREQLNIPVARLRKSL
jgi:RNA polymerase sigma-54 factor